MNKILGLMIFSLSWTATAHVEPGLYLGKTTSGQTCQMTAGVTYFENNVQHPLNERIKIKIGTDEFVVGHPPVVDRKQNMAYFNHDVFQGVLPTATGAKALIIDMIHSATQEGPTGYDLIQHGWKANQRVVVRCTGLQHSSSFRR